MRHNVYLHYLNDCDDGSLNVLVIAEEGVMTGTAQSQFGSLSAYNASAFGWEYVLDG